ncbi:MAG: hypothetical protein NVSMB64_27980 [Candidatus Velthaea sp.]
MKMFGRTFTRTAAIAACALLAACGGGGTSATSALPAAPSTTAGNLAGTSTVKTKALALPTRVYIADDRTNEIRTFSATTAVRIAPTITAGLSFPNHLEVDATGKIYVVNETSGQITTYDAAGTQTPLTIHPPNPATMTIDSAGKIYVGNVDVGNANYSVTTYNPDGTPTTPTVSGLTFPPYGLAVDKHGKIYVTGDNNRILTFNPNGTPNPMTITDGLFEPQSITIDANGKIYVSNGRGEGGPDFITTYNPDGTRTTPTITKGLFGASEVKVDPLGRIFVANAFSGNVTVYAPDGTQLPLRFNGGCDTDGFGQSPGMAIY